VGCEEGIPGFALGFKSVKKGCQLVDRRERSMLDGAYLAICCSSSSIFARLATFLGFG
jgi:hypothetical protein